MQNCISRKILNLEFYGAFFVLIFKKSTVLFIVLHKNATSILCILFQAMKILKTNKKHEIFIDICKGWL